MKKLLVIILGYSLLSCGVFYRFPRIDPMFKYTIFIIGDEIKCLKRCYDFNLAKGVHPSKCGETNFNSFSWWVDPVECSSTEGFHIKDWAEHIRPWLKEIKIYVEDNIDKYNH